MSIPEFSFPINRPTPEPPLPNPVPVNPTDPSGPGGSENDPCKKLQEISADATITIDELHFGTPKCLLTTAYFNTSRSTTETSSFKNGIGYVGSYFQSFDSKSFLRIDGGEGSSGPNFYTYAGDGVAFEMYMYRDGLNIKQKAMGVGNSLFDESFHINIYKGSALNIEIMGETSMSTTDTGLTNIVSDFARQQLIMATSKSNQFNSEMSLQLLADPNRGNFLCQYNSNQFFALELKPSSEIFQNACYDGFIRYYQFKINSSQINWYAQQNANTFFGLEAKDGFTEQVLNSSSVRAAAKASSTASEASFYASASSSQYATLVNKSNNSYVYLYSNGYSFLENNAGTPRCYGQNSAGTNFFDIKGSTITYLQLKNGSNSFYFAPNDIKTNSSNPQDSYASFKKFSWIDAGSSQAKTAAIISSKEIDLTSLGVCWANYDCKPTSSNNCLETLYLGTNTCRLSDFDVVAGSAAQFELYQYSYGITFKPRNSNTANVAIYTNGSNMALDVNGFNASLEAIGTSFSIINCRNANGTRQANLFNYPDGTNGLIITNGFADCYFSADSSYRYLVLGHSFAAGWRTAAGAYTADTTIFDTNNSQVYLGVNGAQAAMGYNYSSNTTAFFGYANGSSASWQGNALGTTYALMFCNSNEGKFQTSSSSGYSYVITTNSSSECSLVSYGNSILNLTGGGANGSISVASNANIYLQGSNGQIYISTAEAQGRYLSIRQITVCVDGVDRNMLILGSDIF